MERRRNDQPRLPLDLQASHTSTTVKPGAMINAVPAAAITMSRRCALPMWEAGAPSGARFPVSIRHAEIAARANPTLQARLGGLRSLRSALHIFAPRVAATAGLRRHRLGAF